MVGVPCGCEIVCENETVIFPNTAERKAECTARKKKKLLRPFQFNYLSYELFLEKKILSGSKKKEKKVTFGVLRTKVVLKFSVRLQKIKK